MQVLLLIYIFLTHLLFNSVDGRLNLQGIATLVITIGMTLDSTVILYSI